MSRSDVSKVIGKVTCINNQQYLYKLEIGRVYDVVKIHNNNYDPMFTLEYSIAHYRVTIPAVYSSRFKLHFDLRAAILLHGTEPDDKF